MRFIIYVKQKSKLFRMDCTIIDFFRNEYFYEVLSISKSVVGLAFLESAINVKESILENISILDVRDTGDAFKKDSDILRYSIK